MTDLEIQAADAARDLTQAETNYSIAALGVEAARISLRNARLRRDNLLDQIRLTQLKGELTHE
jgi:hypothetical protein